MRQFGQHCIRVLYMMVDIFFGYLAVFFACLIQFNKVPFDVSISNILFAEQNPFRLIFALWLLIVVIVSHLHRLYHTDRTSGEFLELWKVVQSNVIATILMIVVSYALKVEGLPRTVVAYGFVFMVLFFLIWRVLKRFIVEYLVVHGYNNRNVLIIGAGNIARALYDEIQRYPGMGLRVKGFLHDGQSPVDEEVEAKIVGNISDFRRVITRQFIEHVFIAAHYDEEIFLKLLLQARKLGIAVDVVPSGYGMVTSDFIKHNVGFIPVLEYSQIGKGHHHIGKRLFDLALAWIGCIVLSIPLLLIALAVVLDSRGPVFFYSERFGRGGRRFKMIKFRTMVAGADMMQKKFLDKNEVDGPIFKMRNDPRVTRFGKFLRKYSLDELPQLFNVIKGDMSLVGPRPFPVDQIERNDLRQLRRLGVRPGITGLWQVKGRSDVAFGKLLRWDIWYINNWSFWLDLSILWQTIPVVLRGRGAY